MQLPTIDLSVLPDLDLMTGMFGSVSDLAQAAVDDRIIIIMVYVYEVVPPDVPKGLF